MGILQPAFKILKLKFTIFHSAHPVFLAFHILPKPTMLNPWGNKCSNEWLKCDLFVYNFASRFLWFMHQTLGVRRWFPKSQTALLNTYGETWTNIHKIYTVCKMSQVFKWVTTRLLKHKFLVQWRFYICSNSAMKELWKKFCRMINFQEKITSQWPIVCFCSFPHDQNNSTGFLMILIHVT